MRKLTFGAMAGLGVLIAAGLTLAPHNEVLAQRANGNQPIVGSELIVVPTPLPDGKAQMLVVIDPRQQALGVYRVELSSGKIALQSVRNIRWDLQMIQFNNENPLPQEIRSLLDQSIQQK
jgi:hypothetical protein